MCAIVGDLIVFDDDKACNASEKSDVVESSVGVGAFLFLLGCVRGLKDEDALDQEQEGGGVEELYSRYVSAMLPERKSEEAYRMC